MDARAIELQKWLGKNIKAPFKIKPLAGDASFRRYFRVYLPDQNYVAMDAPPPKELVSPFMTIAKILQDSKVHAPKIHAADPELGFLLLSDFGDQLLLNQLNETSVDKLYRSSFNTLARIQHCPTTSLQNFDAKLLLEELNLFLEWYLNRHLALTLSPDDEKVIFDTFNLLIASAIEQPQIFVHRDFHSRNILCLPNDQLGILDFQDAVRGPLTYDLVSLLRDCYITWPHEKVVVWAKLFYQNYCAKEYLNKVSFVQYLRWFDWMGLQRHIKVLGIFSRLNYRDQKPNYLNDLPRVLNYVLSVTQQYEELRPFYQFLQVRVK